MRNKLLEMIIEQMGWMLKTCGEVQGLRNVFVGKDEIGFFEIAATVYRLLRN